MENNKSKKALRILEEAVQQVAQLSGNNTQSMQKPKETVVVFDKSTNPYEVKFSERGFEINQTRFSFEFIETALSKDVNIVLDKGRGLSLDAIKMEKIMKYKDLYSNNL